MEVTGLILPIDAVPDAPLWGYVAEVSPAASFDRVDRLAGLTMLAYGRKLFSEPDRRAHDPLRCRMGRDREAKRSPLSRAGLAPC